MEQPKSYSIEEALEFQEAETFEFPFALKLKKPIDLGGDTFKTFVTLKKEPTVETIESLPTSGQKMSDFKPVVAKLIGEPISIINKMSPKDFNAVLELLNPFIG